MKIGEKSWFIEFDKMQQYLDNWLILPKFQAQSTDKNSNYGFQEEPDLRIHFEETDINIHLGRSVPGMEGSFLCKHFRSNAFYVTNSTSN